MKEPKKITAVVSSWDSKALLTKAELYAATMLEAPREEWQFGLWSSLAIELLARAALSNISPVLLAEAKSNWHHLYYGLGLTPPVKKYVPRSIGTTEVLSRLHELIPGFTEELKNACITHVERRNTELHSGDMAFTQSKATTWLPSYYEACSVLLKSMGRDLASFVGPDEMKAAEKLMSAARDNKSKDVAKAIGLHLATWEKYDKSQKIDLTSQAVAWATKHIGHRVKCPSCNSVAIVTGDPIAAPRKSIQDDIITEKQEFLPRRFECIACGLKLSGLSSLTAAGLSATYVSTSEYDASEYYAEEDASRYWEDDNNEPN